MESRTERLSSVRHFAPAARMKQQERRPADPGAAHKAGCWKTRFDERLAEPMHTAMSELDRGVLVTVRNAEPRHSRAQRNAETPLSGARLARRAAQRCQKEKIALSSGLMGIVTMCRCAMKRPSVGGGARRVLSERGSQSGMPSCETKRSRPGHGSQVATVIKNNALWNRSASEANYGNR